MIALPPCLFGLGQRKYIETTSETGDFPMVHAGRAASIRVDPADYPGVQRAAGDLKNDIARVTGIAPIMVKSQAGLHTDAIIIGTIGKSPLIDGLVRDRKIDVVAISGKWESFLLEYEVYLFHPGRVEVETILAPTLNFVPGRGLRYAVSFDDQPPQIIDALAQNTPDNWAQTVEDSVRKVKSTHTVEGVGYHTLKFWMVDPGVVLQKLVVDVGGVKPSYLGPPESFHHP